MQMHTLQSLGRAHGQDLMREFVTTTIDAGKFACRLAIAADDRLRETAKARRQRWQAYEKARRDRAAMFAMSERMLADIGIARHDIHFGSGSDVRR